MTDPFAQLEDNTEEINSVAEVDAPEKMPEVSQVNSGPSEVGLTFKSGTSYAAPWITVKASDVHSAYAMIADVDGMKSLMDAVIKFNGYFSKQEQPQQAQPQAVPDHQQAPGGEERFCQHGSMTYRAGFSKKTGKPYKAFFCPAPQGQGQCSPQFMN